MDGCAGGTAAAAAGEVPRRSSVVKPRGAAQGIPPPPDEAGAAAIAANEMYDRIKTMSLSVRGGGVVEVGSSSHRKDVVRTVGE